MRDSILYGPALIRWPRPSQVALLSALAVALGGCDPAVGTADSAQDRDAPKLAALEYALANLPELRGDIWFVRRPLIVEDDIERGYSRAEHSPTILAWVRERGFSVCSVQGEIACPELRSDHRVEVSLGTPVEGPDGTTHLHMVLMGRIGTHNFWFYGVRLVLQKQLDGSWTVEDEWEFTNGHG